MIKERIVSAFQAAGYDTITACELAHAKIKELQSSPPGLYTFQAGSELITVERHA